MADDGTQLTAFDADNHYYEALDAFTRYIEPEYAKRAMQWAELNGRQVLLVGGKVNRFIPNPTFDKLSAPGSLEQYFRGNNPKGESVKELFGDLEQKLDWKLVEARPVGPEGVLVLVYARAR